VNPLEGGGRELRDPWSLRSERGFSRLVILIAGGAALVVALAVVAWAVLGGAEDPAAGTVPYRAGEFLTNLADNGGRRFIRVVVEFSVDDRLVTRELDQKSAAVADGILAVLRSKTLAEVEGAAGMEALARDIAARVNGLLKTGRVTRVFFVEFIIQ